MRIGPYEVLGELGRGGMGAVLRAREPSGREVAIKIIRGIGAERLARFERERRLLASFTAHDGFVPLLDAGQTPEGPYLVMPIVAGGTLGDKLARGPLGVEATIALGRTLAAALARAHDRGIVHRDLKPQNVLFTAAGAPLVADLGLGKHFDRDAPGASQSVAMSTAGGARGTFGYMPIEQMRDASSVGPEADVFALGAILYECLTGRPAFDGESYLGLLANVEAGRFEPLARADAPAWLAAVVGRALAPAVRDRFANGAAFSAALAAPARRGRTPLLVALLACALALALAGYELSTPRRDEPAPVSPPPVRVPDTAPRALTQQEVARLGEKIAAALEAGGTPAAVASDVALVVAAGVSLPKGARDRIFAQLRQRVLAVKSDPAPDDGLLVAALQALRLARGLQLSIKVDGPFVEWARTWARHFRIFPDEQWRLEAVDAFMLVARELQDNHFFLDAMKGASALARSHPELAADARADFEEARRACRTASFVAPVEYEVEFLASDGRIDEALSLIRRDVESSNVQRVELVRAPCLALYRAGWPPRAPFPTQLLDALIAAVPASTEARALRAFLHAGYETPDDVAALEGATELVERVPEILGSEDVRSLTSAEARERRAALGQLAGCLDRIPDARTRARVLLRLGRREDAARVLEREGGELAALAPRVRAASEAERIALIIHLQ